MTKMIFVSFTVTHLQASIAFADPDEHVWGSILDGSGGDSTL